MEIIPQRVHVAIDVARELAYATLPVVPVLTGDPADGYRVTDVSADPQTLTVSGEAAAVERMSSISTMPLDVTGLTEGVDAAVAADLPPGVSLVADEEVQLHVDIAPDEESRTWQVGVRLEGARASRQYSLSTPTVLVTFAGPLPALDSLEPSTIDASVAVGRLAPGTHEVDVVVEPIEGLELVSVAPAAVRVEVAAARSSASPEPSRSPEAASPAPASATPGPASSVAP